VSDSKEYQRLKKIWYAKLAATGFEDIEPNENTLKKWSYSFNRHYDTADLIQAKADYYYEAGHFLNSHKFETEVERVIWEYHTNGLSIRNIIKILKKAKIRKKYKYPRKGSRNYDRNSVWEVLDRLRNIMRGM